VAASANASGLAGRYAGALFELARDRDALDQVAADLSGLKGLISESADFARLIASPVLTRDEQSRALTAIAGKANTHPLTQQFLGLIAQKRRAFVLPNIADAYQALLAAHKGEVTAEVTSAVELSPEQIEVIRTKIAAAERKDVTMATTVDPSLLGGLVVRVGSHMIDASLKTKLHQLELAMKGAA
jgi:F-type H+-transporting ATPase subunit delta